MHRIRFDSAVPDGWSSVPPAEVGEEHASAVLLRGENRSSRLIPSIVVTEYILGSAVDLSEVAHNYSEHKRARTIGLEITRSEWIAKGPSSEYAQEMRFLLVSGVTVKLTHMAIATPTVSGETHVLEIVFTISEDEYLPCRHEFGTFLRSLRIATE